MRKGRCKRPIIVALGIWPDTNQAQVLGWMVGHNEEAQAWEHFLSRLEAAGIHAEQGLRLLIHDGGSGLCAALAMVHFGASTQRCLFHKLRNIAQAVQLPKGLSRSERTARRKAILKRFRAIRQARRYPAALRRWLQVVRDFRHTQPDAVAGLRRNCRPALPFYCLADTYPDRPLCAGSRLERFFRIDSAVFTQLTKIDGAWLRDFQQHSNEGVAPEQLLADVWKRPDASPRRVQEAIRRLRLQLELTMPPVGTIENERGRGYRFVPALS